MDCPTPLPSMVNELALWLQLTHELELRNYWEKRSAAAKQLMTAKEAVSCSCSINFTRCVVRASYFVLPHPPSLFLQCDRVRRKRSTFVGSVRLIHSDNLDDVDSKLNAAK